MRKISRSGLVAVVLTLLSLSSAKGSPPIHPLPAAWPFSGTDPSTINYADPAQWPSDPNYGVDFGLWSFVPATTDLPLVTQVDPRTITLGTGSHFNVAWTATIGYPRIIIAIVDSGANWSNPDLALSWYLNPGELSPPACNGNTTVYDLNGDGAFNVLDYTTIPVSASVPPTPSFSAVCDSRLMLSGDVNNNGIVDPEDLLAAFGDQSDSDNNGYVDDISGWDFLHNDSNAKDDTGFGRGDAAATLAAAQGNNMLASLGVCPMCQVIMLRVSDSYASDANAYGVATVYAVDQGASVVDASATTYDNAPLMQAAVDYAYGKNVTVVTASGDGDSFRHEFPATNNHTVVANAITFNTPDLASATTFFAFNNCTNYGGATDFTIPTADCSSGSASARAAGLAGLMYSVGYTSHLTPPSGNTTDLRTLTANEVKQLMNGTVDNFYDASDTGNADRYPTTMGFARRFGHGRANARSAVDAIIAQKIPPSVDITGPAWFDAYNQAQASQIAITGRVGYRSAAQNADGVTIDYVVEWAPGVDPADTAFTKIGGADGLTSEVNGALAMWDISKVSINNAVAAITDSHYQPDDPSEKFAATIRVRATVHTASAGTTGVTGEARRTVHIYNDTTLLPKFPITLGGSGESSPKIVDLLGTGKRVIVAGDGGGFIHAIRADGTELPGWPVRTEVVPLLDPATMVGKSHQTGPGFSTIMASTMHAAIVGAVAVGDIDGDKKPDIVAATIGGHVWAFHVDGTVINGFPVAIDFSAAKLAVDANHPVADAISAAPVLADFDGHGVFNIVVASQEGKVYVWNGGGIRVSGFPVTVADPSLTDNISGTPPRQLTKIFGAPAVGDVNGDHIPEIAVATSESYNNVGRLYLIDGRGMNTPTSPFVAGWPVAIASTAIAPASDVGIPSAPIMGDIDGDGVPEILVAGQSGVVMAYDRTGVPAFDRVAAADAGTTKSTPYPALNNAKGSYGVRGNANSSGAFVLTSSAALGDIDNDGHIDCISGSVGAEIISAFLDPGLREDFEHHLDAWDVRTGTFKPGFPQRIEDWVSTGAPAIADVTGDSVPEVIAGSAGYFVHAWDVAGTEAAGFPKFTGGSIVSTPAVGDLDGDGKLELAVTTRDGYLYAWSTAGNVNGAIDWASFHHDDQNSGNFATPIGQANPKLAGGGSGCGFALGRSSLPLVCLLLLVFALRMWRRTRRS